MRRTSILRLTAVAAGVAITTAAALVPASAGTRTGGTPAAAVAVPQDDTSVVSSVAPVRKDGKKHTYTRAERRGVEAAGGDPEVLAYWTPERMAAATSLDRPGDRKAVEEQATAVTRGLAAAEDEPFRVVSEPAAPEGVRSLATVTQRGTRTVGKLFIGSGHVCSASTINTGSKRVIITAGHCLHQGDGGGWYDNLVFVPRYNGHADDPTPYGTFQVATMHVFRAWARYGSWGRDVGFATTYANDDGRRVGSVVGANGLTVGGRYSFGASIFGYPGNLSGGERMYRCDVGVRYFDAVDHTSVARGCNFGRGSSGGPWIWRYNQDGDGLGYTRGVTSFGPRDSRAYIASPHFDDAVNDLRVIANQAF